MLLNLFNFFKNHALWYLAPLSLPYAWSFGALTGIFLSIQLVTGVLLGFHYDAGEFAFESVEYMMRDVSYGWLISYLHANSASFYFLCMYMHMARGIFFKSYSTPRHFAWGSGVFILLLSMVTAFLGYVLPWGQMSYWAATVIVRLMTMIPKVGTQFVEWLWGNFIVASITLMRFFELHYGLSILLVLAVLWHISFVHNTGSSTSYGLTVEGDSKWFGSFFTSKDVFMTLLVLFMFLWIVFYYPNWLGHPDNYIKANPLSTPKHMVPEWYFLPFYAMLSSFETKAMGVSALMLSVLVLLCLPLCKEDVKSDLLVFGMNLNWFFYVFMINFVCLGFMGSMPAEYPFIQAGIFHSVLYFTSIYIFFHFCKVKNSFMRLLISTPKILTNKLNNKMTNLKNLNFLMMMFDIVEEFTFMEKWNTLKDNPHYKEDLVIAFVVMFCTLYFFLSNNKFCLKARFQKIFFKVIELRVGDKFDKRLLSFVCIWYFYGLFLYMFYNNMQGTLVYSTTFATYFQLPLSVSFMAFSVAFFVAFGDYSFKWLSGFFPIGVPAGVGLALLIIEFSSFCMSLLSLAARLFINMLAGHLLLKMFAHSVCTMTMFLWFGYFEGTFVTYILSFLFCYLEYLAGFLQAAVLSSLVAIYINDCSKFAQNN